MALLSTEGTAQYMEKLYLADPAAYGDPLLAEDPASRQFVKPSEDAPERGESSRNYRWLGNPLYTLGDLVARLLDRAGPGGKKSVSERENLLIGAVEAALEHEP